MNISDNALFSQADNEPSEQDITAAYNKILAQEIEDSVQTAIEEWGGDRATVEVEIAKTIYELFDVFGENPRPVMQTGTVSVSGEGQPDLPF